MKVTIYTMTTDDDNGIGTQAFATEAEMYAAIWDYLSDADGTRTAEELKAAYGDDIGGAWEHVRRNLDSLTWDEHKIELPATPLESELLAALKSLFEHCSMIHKHWGEDCNQKEAEDARKAGLAAIAKAEAAQAAEPATV